MDIALIPESAPFNPEQRAWLNGFLAGWLGLNAGAPTVPDGVIGAISEARVATAPIAEPEPWHDPALGIDERLQLAEGKTLPNRLMAAMAQLDCGSCGYLCRTYAEAIATGAETRLSLCSPGGSETARVVKRLLKEAPTTSTGAATNGVAKNGATKGAQTVGTRDNPYEARIARTVNLNGHGSEKETRHVEIDLGTHGPSYAVGDSLGVYPENCPALVEELVATLGARGEEIVTARSGSATTLYRVLRTECCLTDVSEGLVVKLSEAAVDSHEAAQLRAIIDDDSAIAGHDVLDLLRRFPSARLAPHVFVEALSPIRPRLYSISSSPKRHAGQVHLTVRRVTYQHNGRERKGVASTMLSDRVEAGSPVRVFVQKSHGFTLPQDPSTPIIMIGPGTGIAPFRAFLHERYALAATGKAWLFFGDQRSAHDFLYEDELTDFFRRGILTRLDTAFSRDQERKIYVQHRIVERGAELFAWLQDGAHVYVCGDAKRMAADVDRALRDVVRTHGVMSEQDAAKYVTALTSAGRYRRDVY